MRHRRILEACHPAHDLVERAVAAAGIEPDFLPGFRRASGQSPAVAGGLRDADLIIEPTCAADALDVLRKARRLI